MQEDRPMKYTICLAKNWNLMSIPVVPHYGEIETTLAPIMDSLYEVWTFEGNDWYRFMPGDPTSTLHVIKDGQGYFVRMYWPDCLDGQGWDYCTPHTGPTGMPPMPPDYPVREGWNAIGFSFCDCAPPWGTIDEADAWCDFPDLPCTECDPCGHDPSGLKPDWYLWSMNVGALGLDPDIVYRDEARTMVTWVPWQPGQPGMWRAIGQCENLMPGMGALMKASLPDLSIVPPFPTGF
jgi:hypothetical protein